MSTPDIGAIARNFLGHEIEQIACQSGRLENSGEDIGNRDFGGLWKSFYRTVTKHHKSVLTAYGNSRNVVCAVE
jgi:hypothetical protein